jgi:hypothetical protein
VEREEGGSDEWFRDKGTGGGTSSCTLRSAEAKSTAGLIVSAAAEMGRIAAGADPYFLLHSSVLCVVESGWLVQEPAGYLPAADVPFLTVSPDLVASA